MIHYLCFKCQQRISKAEEMGYLYISSDNYVYVCNNCINNITVSGNAADTGQPAASPQLNKNGGLKCHKEQ